ncbi:hypothetical protein I552_1011 [Mycobacterium xenopi 3993]|nr:hypothetical protein I552_1011 [Mycobacterium xenopi 3993]
MQYGLGVVSDADSLAAGLLALSDRGAESRCANLRSSG